MEYIKQNLFEFIVITLFLLFYIIKKLYFLKHKYRLGGGKRSKVLSNFALINGLRYERKYELADKEHFENFEILAGKNKAFEHILRGTTWKGEAVIFDFFCEKPSGKIVSKTAATFNLAFLKLPQCRIYHSSDWDIIFEDTLPYESFPLEFSEKYAVSTTDAKQLTDFLNDELQKLLITNEGWTMEISKGWLLLAKGRGTVSIGKYKAYLNEIFDFLDNFKTLAKK